VAVVTFSREAHSGTQDLARLLAERLGYRYVSRDELTRAVTAHGGVERVPQTAESEGRALSRWEQLGEQLTGERATYVASLKAVINDLALADNVVIVGHGAGQFLSDLRGIVRVFVVAPMEDRVARLMAEGVDDADRARRMVDEQDRESAAYLRYLFGIDWLDPHAWDLVINTGRTTVSATLDMLAHYVDSLVRDEAERVGLTGQQLASHVEQGLLADPSLGVDKLTVQVEPWPATHPGPPPGPGSAAGPESAAATQPDSGAAAAAAGPDPGAAAGRVTGAAAGSVSGSAAGSVSGAAAGDGFRVVLHGEALTGEDRARAEMLAAGLAPGAALDNRIVVRPPMSC
jgi:cytidylate kinase